MEGTTDNATDTSGSTSASGASVTATGALEKAAAAASSAAAQPAGGPAGDTSKPTGDAKPGAPAATIAQPTSTGPAADAAATRGPIPLDRHEEIVRGLRSQLDTLAWARELKPEDVKRAVRLISALDSDSKGFYQQLGRELGVEVRPSADETLPEPDLISPDGKVKAYSADALAKYVKVEVGKALAGIRQEVKPLQDFHRTEQQRVEEATRQAEAQRFSTDALKKAENLPHFKEHKKAIADKLEALSREGGQAWLDSVGAVGALYEAYNAVLAEVVFPGIESAAEQRVRDNNARKAAASVGSAHPTSQAGEPAPPKLENVRDLSRHMERLERQMTTQ